MIKLTASERPITKGAISLSLNVTGPPWSICYPPSYCIIQEMLKEVRRCTQEGVTINTFMLESSAYLGDFLDRIMGIKKGRAFCSSLGTLGEYVLVDYLSNRKRRIT
ncbi:MAG: hypothetical protein QGI09_07315 [Dehalococcoidia bacterium]|jgi:uncharacterized protein with von Willebrand factor type A (vWA) domain|nr:hypothetical protein [Dehalococcoidia bacterium]